MKRMLSFVVATIVTVGLVAGAGAAADPRGRCSSAKLKAAAKKASTKLKCHASANAKGVQVDGTCLAKAEEKFSASWQKIEALGGGCGTATNEGSVESQIDAMVSNLAVQLAPCGRPAGGTCGGSCPFGLNCFEIGIGCYGEPEPCRCHSSTTTCPPPTTTTSTLP